jgi:hypothetical protein
MDTTQIAALVAAATGLVAATTGVTNLALSILRDRPGLTVYIREWAADRYGHERYIEVVAANAKPRQNSVVAMGLRLRGQQRTWKIEDGPAKPALPATLEDGEVATMVWMREELGQEFAEGDAVIAGCFAIDGRGREVQADPDVRASQRP